jgi:hypothetical protein
LDLRGRKWWEGWRGPHNEELRKLYTSPNIVRVIKSRRTGLAGHVECTGETRKFWLEKLKGRDHSEDLDIDGKIILE